MSLHAASRSGYGAATRAMGSPREVEYRVFAQVNAQLARALREDAPFAELADALHENTRLWVALGLDLARPDNALPESLRARLLSLAIFMRRHSEAVLRGRAGAEVIVEINTTVMRGLRGGGGAGADAGAAPPPAEA